MQTAKKTVISKPTTASSKVKKYTHEEVLKAATNYFKGDELAANVWLNKYALKDTQGNLYELTPDDMHHRIANEIARIEQKYPDPYSAKEIYDVLKGFKYIVPQGSPMAGIGNNFQVSSLSNCFVIGNDADSYGGIILMDQEQAQLMKRRGGVGHDLSHIRPRGSQVMNSALSSTGIVPFMERYSNCTREVAQDGRRGALMLSISSKHPDVEDFVDAKMEQGKVTGANVSVRIDDDFMKAAMSGQTYQQQYPIDSATPKVTKELDAGSLWDKIIYNAWKSAEPGVLFWDTVIRESVADCYADLGYKTVSTNPCVTGETLVAVADGRGHVPISQLVEEGKDVPVYCLDKEGKLAIEMMRHPRKTGFGEKIFKVTLEDGHSIQVTENHKFRLKNGEYKAVSDLQAGESLMILSRFQAPIVREKGKTKNDYWWLNEGVFGGNKSEHRLIATNTQGTAIQAGEVVHHIDRDSLNNHPDNLEIMSKAAHDLLHSEEMKGDKNPIFAIKADPQKFANYSAKMSAATSGLKNGNAYQISNEVIVEKAVELTQALGRRFSKKEWQAFAEEQQLPMTFSKFREEALGTIHDLALSAAKTLDLQYKEQDPRLVRTWMKATAQGYNAKIESGKVSVEKICEKCGTPFWTNYHTREISYCTFGCVNQYLNTDKDIYQKRSQSVNVAYAEKATATKKQQLDVYTQLRYTLTRKPLLKEWEAACKDRSVPFRLKTKHGFKSWSELQEKAIFHNHRIQSIEFVGYEDVYNGTVDTYHNFFTGGWKTATKSGKDKFLYVNQLNCGEIPLCPYDSCRLLAINLYSYVENPYTKKATFNFEKFGQHVQMAQRIMDNIIDLELEKIDKIIDKIKKDPESDEIKSVEYNLWHKIKKTCLEGRRTGVGITAEGDMLAAMGLRYGSDDGLEFSVKVHQTLALNAYRSSVELAKKRGPFGIYDASREMKNPLIQRIREADQELYDDMVKYGRRNIALLTIAPTGTTSLMTQTTSGIEPAFMVAYKRRRKVNPNDKNVNITFTDEVGDNWEEYNVFHHKFMVWLEVAGYDMEEVKQLPQEELQKIIDKSPYYKATANDVDWVQKVKMQGAIQKWVDHSISVTVNVPEETTVDMVKQIYQTAWEEGCKGCTIYRDGSRSGVLIANTEKKEEANDGVFKESFAPKRPKRLEAEVIRFQNNHEKWIAMVGVLDGRPYEIFTGRAEDTFVFPTYVTNGWVIKQKDEEGNNCYNFQYSDKDGYKVTMEGLSRSFDKKYWNYAKLISGILRHGMPLNYVVNLVSGLNTEQDHINTWKNGVVRALKKFIPDGTQAAKTACPECDDTDGLIYKEGCLSCKSCGYSKCG